MTQVKKQDKNYIIEFDFLRRPTEWAWQTSDEMKIQIAGGGMVIRQAMPQGAVVAVPTLSQPMLNPTKPDRIVFTDAQGVPFREAALLREPSNKRASVFGMIQEHVTITLATTQPEQGPPAIVKVIGHRSRTITVPFEFKNPLVGK